MIIIVEPYGCWQNRMSQQQFCAQEEARQRNIGRLHPIEQDLMYLVREYQEPIRETALAHAFAEIAGYHNREERLRGRSDQ